MKIRVVAAVFAVAFISVVFPDAARADWSAPKIVDRTPVPSVSSVPCAGVRQATEVIGIGKRLGCLFSTKPGVFGHDGGLAASLTADGAFYPVKGMCDTGLECSYSSATDTVVGRKRAAPFGFELFLARDFTQHVSWRIQPGSLLGFYHYDGTTESAFHLENGARANIGQFTLSHNGKWVIAEIPDKGTAVLNTESMQSRRIMAPGYLYGRGMDPFQHLAISNDGRAGIVTGENSGFNVVSITEGCGEVLGSLADNNFRADTTPCLTSDLGIGVMIPGFYAAYHPVFDDNSLALSVKAMSRLSGAWQVVVRSSSQATTAKIIYLALGDSFTSGEGETEDTFYLPGTNTPHERCHTSSRSYPFLVSGLKAVPLSLTKNVACSGARITDIISPGRYDTGQGGRLKSDEAEELKNQAMRVFIPGRVPQLSFVAAYTPENITVGIGGNDAGLMDKVGACAMPGTCEWAKPELRTAVAEEMTRQYGALVSLYEALVQRVPASKLYAVGYPIPVAVDGRCDAATSLLLNRDEREFLHQSVVLLNEVVRAAAKTAGIHFIDIAAVYEGHRLCDASAMPAMNGVRLGGDIGLLQSVPLLNFIGSETFHPTPFGHQLMAKSIADNPSVFTSPCQCREETIPEVSDYWAGASRKKYVYSAADLTDKTTTGLVNVRLGAGSVKADSALKVEVHSDTRLLIEGVAANDGSFSATTTLPKDLEEGIHTLHAIGQDIRGEAVDYYQAFRYEKGEDLKAGALAGDPLVEQSSDRAFQRTNDEGVVKSASSDRILVPVASSVETEKSNFLPLLWISMGIMTVWLILALSLRNLFRKNFFKKLSQQVTFWRRL